MLLISPCLTSPPPLPLGGLCSNPLLHFLQAIWSEIFTPAMTFLKRGIPMSLPACKMQLPLQLRNSLPQPPPDVFATGGLGMGCGRDWPHSAS